MSPEQKGGVVSIVYVRGDCPFSTRMIDEMRAAGERPVTIDLETEPRAVPELIKLTGGRRIVPVRVTGTRVEVAPDGGSEF